jgi:hypothetical protein
MPIKGGIVSPETRAKISMAKIGHVVSAKTRKKLSIVLKSSAAASASRAKLHAAAKGKHHTVESKDRIRRALMGNKNSLGCSHSLATRKKISEAMCGRPAPWMRRRGKDAANWQGGITMANHGLRKAVAKTEEYQVWRQSVFARDGFKCRKCGAAGYLHAHHKKAFSKIIRAHNVESVEQAIACQELWDIANGTTLCKDCHKELGFHATEAT